MLDLKHSVPKLLIGAVAVIVPALLSYCQATSEAEVQAAHASREADAGYKALVQSVRNLEQVVQTQGDAIRALARSHEPSAGPGPAWPDAGLPGPAAGSAAPLPDMAAAAAPSFPELPDSNAEALRQQAR